MQNCSQTDGTADAHLEAVASEAADAIVDGLVNAGVECALPLYCSFFLGDLLMPRSAAAADFYPDATPCDRRGPKAMPV